MNYSWMNDYIGLPYLAGGRHPDGIDCYGLCKLVYLDRYNVILPDWQEDILSNFRSRSETIESVIHSGTFTRHSEPQDGDFVFCYKSKIAHHVGLFYRDGVLHAHSEGKRGSVFEAFPRFEMQFGELVIGSWTP